jgi:hypothetical protein
VLIPNAFEHVADLVTHLGATVVVKPTGGHLGAAPDDHIDLPEAVQLILPSLDARR